MRLIKKNLFQKNVGELKNPSVTDENVVHGTSGRVALSMPIFIKKNPEEKKKKKKRRKEERNIDEANLKRIN